MKAYQRIAIPREGLNDSEELELSDLTSNAEIYNVICMTIEELREVFHEGHKSGINRTISQSVDNPHLVKLLNAYLTSKNIQI